MTRSSGFTGFACNKNALAFTTYANSVSGTTRGAHDVRGTSPNKRSSGPALSGRGEWRVESRA
jgi:hypothetical protein